MSTVSELIEVLEQEDPALVVPNGFSSPHSYRGFYERLAVEPASNVTVGEMLADLRGAIGTTYEGYKGGEYEMGEWSDVHLAEYGTCGEELGVRLLRYMIAEAKAAPDV